MPDRNPPGPKSTLYFGNAFAYARDPLGFVTKCAREYGDVVSMNLPGYGGILLSSPADIELMLRGRHKDFIKDPFMHAAEDVIGNGLLASEGDLWRKQRKMMSSFFQLEQIRQFGADMIDHAERRLDTWKAGETRNIHNDMMHVTLEIIAKTLFDTEIGADADRLSEILDKMLAIFLNPLVVSKFYRSLPLPSNLRYRHGVKVLDDMAYRRIREKRAQGTAGAKDLLAKMLDARDDEGNPMPDKQIRDELITMILAGHETTALVLSFTFYLLGLHPEVEAKLAAEIADKIGNRTPMSEDYQNLEYARWVVKESMRLYPPAWSVSRESLVETEFGGYKFPKGTPFTAAQWVVHRDPRWFDDPEAFKPERWADDFEKKIDRGAYFPFGDGPRICIGQFFALMEAVLILASVIRRFKLTLVDQGPLDLVPSLTMRPKHGIRMTVNPR